MDETQDLTGSSGPDEGSAAGSTADPTAGGVDASRPRRVRLGGRYELRGLLGQGGMADVVLAYDEQLERDVAVKILHARYANDPAFLTRFRREAQAVAGLSHPNIVAVYDAGQQDGRPFMVMEYLRGSSLAETLAHHRLTSNRALEVIGDAALGLHYAHERQLVHRDIKPANILLGEEGQVKVADFGIARAVGAQSATQTAAVLGTAAYVAPEQARGGEVDRRTDVYALGCVLYEALTGQPPFSGDSAVALAYQHVSEAPIPPTTVEPSLGPALDSVVLKAMAKDPADRYQTAKDFHADLQRVLAGIPVQAPVPGAWTARTQALEPEPGGATEVLEPVEPQPPRRRLGRTFLLTLIVLALFGVAAFLALRLFSSELGEVVVPDVTGFTLEQAQSTLRAEGLDPVIDPDREASEDIPAGDVVRTDPAAGAIAEEASTVTLILSAGPEPVSVPDLAGLSVPEAQEALAELELALGDEQREPSEDVDVDLVIRTAPPAGAEVEPGSEVALVVSDGPEDIEVPDVTGLVREEAQRLLGDACEPRPCFDVSVETEPSSEVDRGRVISQDPAGGSDAAPGARVTIVVSDGPDTVSMPDVTGESESTAVGRLRAACQPEPCVTVTVDREPSSNVEQGRVIRQDPSAGSTVRRGSTVRIVVSSGPPPEPDPPDPDPPDPDPPDPPENGEG